DSHTDVAVLNQDSMDISVAFGNGDGTFSDINPNLAAKLSEMGDGTPIDLAASDLNGDLFTDMVAITNSQGSDLPSSILLGRNRSFSTAFFGTDPDAMNLGIADFDGDGNIDLITLDPPGVTFFKGDGTGKFAQGVAIGKRG